MIKFIKDNIVFVVAGIPAMAGLFLFMLYDMSQNEWEYDLGCIFWTIAIVAIPVTAGIYKLVTRKKK